MAYSLSFGSFACIEMGYFINGKQAHTKRQSLGYYYYYYCTIQHYYYISIMLQVKIKFRCNIFMLG